MGRLSATITLALCVAPRLAEACPACAASSSSPVSQYVLIGALVAVPYAVATVITKLIRKNLD
jgi:hypothetical protein